MQGISFKELRKRRNIFVIVLTAIVVFFGLNPTFITERQPFDTEDADNSEVLSQSTEPALGTDKASDVLETLTVKGRAAKTGYSRSAFGDGWAQVGGCDVRNIMLQRGLVDIELADDGCIVLSGVLQDPYTGNTLPFLRGSTTSGDVQIDHVVALSDSWQKGAQQLDFATRVLLSNDPLNLLAVEGSANQQKGDSDAASWLPSNKGYRCIYVARQIAVKSKYNLWVTSAEKAAMSRVLNGCNGQLVPAET